MTRPVPAVEIVPAADIAAHPAAVAAVEALPNDQLAIVTDRFNMDTAGIASYLRPGEQLTGFGSGGSESLVMFVTCPVLGQLVRKVCAEDLSSVGWDPAGTGVMAPPSTKGALQVSYLQSLPDGPSQYFPQVFNAHIREIQRPDGGVGRQLVYDQSMIKGVEVSNFIADSAPTPGVVAHLHREIMRLLDEQVHPCRQVEHTGDSIEPSHLDKIVARLELSRNAAPKTFGPLIDAERIAINGTQYRNIKELLAFFRQPHIKEMLEPRTHALVMGDTNTENVMITKPEVLIEAMRTPGRPEFTYDNVGIKFIDPRAIGHNSVGGETTDDRMYDNKPVHNTLGNYDVIHGEHFSIAVDNRPALPRVMLQELPDNPYAVSYAGMSESDYFDYVMQGWQVNHPDRLREDPNWLLRFTFMMGSHFAAMPPFHFVKGHDGVVAEDVQQQKRAIAIYCEGIKWFNRAYDMVTGERTSMYGVQMPPLAPSGRGC